MVDGEPMPEEMGELSGIRCPVCGRFYPINYLGSSGQYPPMCVRCALNTPAMREIASVGNNCKLLADLIKSWDVAYQKSLERKLHRENHTSSVDNSSIP
jgi:hypothetical protein